MGDRPVIGIDASRAFDAERTGTETYSFQLIRALAQRSHDWHYFAYVNSRVVEFSELSSSMEVKTIPFPRFWTHGRLSFEMVRHPPDVLFVPAHVIPLIHPTSVVTIHDLGYLHVPDAHPPRQRRMLDLTTRWNARTARHIIVPSSATARDVIRRYGVDPQGVSIIPHGVSPAFTPASEPQRRRIREAYGLRRPFVLSVGTVQPRKNYGRLAAAVRRLVDDGVDIDLAISGKRGWLWEAAMSAITNAGLGDRLHMLGYVPAGDLPALYAAADVFVLVSLNEGFGLPALEAMAVGTPVVVANDSSLPEVVDGAGLIVDPRAIGEIAAAIRSVLSDPDAGARFVSEGRARAAQFTWDRAASQTEAVFRQALTDR